MGDKMQEMDFSVGNDSGELRSKKWYYLYAGIKVLQLCPLTPVSSLPLLYH